MRPIRPGRRWRRDDAGSQNMPVSAVRANLTGFDANRLIAFNGGTDYRYAGSASLSPFDVTLNQGRSDMNSKILGALAAVALLAACSSKNDRRLDRRGRGDRRPGPRQPGGPGRQRRRSRLLRLRPVDAEGRRARDARPAGRLARQVSAGQRAGGRQLRRARHRGIQPGARSAPRQFQPRLSGRARRRRLADQHDQLRQGSPDGDWATTSRPGRRTATRSPRSADPGWRMSDERTGGLPMAAGFACSGGLPHRPPASGIIRRDARSRADAGMRRAGVTAMTARIGEVPARGMSALFAAAGGVAAGRSRRRWRAARGSRCRTRSWNCGARCRRCRISRAGRRRPDRSRPRRLSAAAGRRQRSRRAAAVAGGRAGGTGAPAARPDRRDAEPGAATGCRAGQADRRPGVPGAEPAGRDRRRPGPAPMQPPPLLPPTTSPPGNLALLPPPTPLGGPPPARQLSPGPGPAHAGTGDAGGQRRTGAPRLRGRRTGGARGAGRQPHVAARL